jgi:non-ribosomal peptide synthetase component F
MPQDSSPDLGYWIDRLRDKDQCIFPTLNDGVKEVNERQRLDVRTPGLGPLNEFCQNHDLKLSTVFQTAWGLVVRSYTGVDDVCFGFRADPSEILPCQMSLTRESSLKHALDTVETTFTRDSNHRTCSVKDMEDVLKLGRAGIFNTIVNYRNTLEQFGSSTCNGQRNDQKMHCHVVHGESDNGNHEDDTPESQYMIAVDIKLSPKFIWMSLSYRLSDLSKGQAANVASSLEKALSCVLNGAQETVGEQHLFSEHHQRQVNEWNRDRPEWIDLTLHEAIATQVRSQPDAPAIRAWDEEWTYHEMDELSSRLARHLVQIGVKTGMRIPLVFERSGWWVIALLAVSKAGGAFVPVDPTQPVLRLKEILQDVEPQFLLSSSQYSGLLADSVETTVVVSRAALEELSSKTSSPTPLPKVSSKDVAYVMVRVLVANSIPLTFSDIASNSRSLIAWLWPNCLIVHEWFDRTPEGSFITAWRVSSSVTPLDREYIPRSRHDGTPSEFLCLVSVHHRNHMFSVAGSMFMYPE